MKSLLQEKYRIPFYSRNVIQQLPAVKIFAVIYFWFPVGYVNNRIATDRKRSES